MESKVVTKDILWMELDEWTFESCTAHFGECDWIYVLYDIESQDKRKWHATQLLKDAIWYYVSQWFKISWTIALNEPMLKLYQKFWFNNFDTELWIHRLNH